MERICFNCFHNLNEDDQACPFCGFQINIFKASSRVLVPGTVLDDKYVVGRTLGEGGFGITYLAWDRNMKTKVAIKEYFPGTLVTRDTTMYGGNTLYTVTQGGRSDFETGMKRYVEEAAILAKFFNLPGIVSVKDFFYENGTAYMVMEYVDGISLKEYLKSKGGRLSVEETLRIMEPIISSLAIVHSNKLLHRDISPDNIMLGRNGAVKLIDFGAARYFEGEYEKSMTVVLKHGYAPVEQYSRKGEQDVRTDIYALCAVMYRMLVGSVPEEAIERVGQDRLQPIRQIERKVPKYIAQVVEKGLSIYPEGRQHDMQELHDELYITSKDFLLKQGDKVYCLVRKCLTFLIILLVIVVGGSMFYLVNKEKIDGFREKIESVFNDDAELDTKAVIESGQVQDDEANEEKLEKVQEEPQTEILENIREVQNNDSPQDMAGQGTGVSNEQHVVLPEELKAEPPDISDTNEVQPEDIPDEELEYAIMVARDGTLNGRNQSFTVGDILDKYSDSQGIWTGYRNNVDQFLIYYQGVKNGESFAIEFTVYANDTFKVTGAAKNGRQEEQYADFFQEILDKTGA